MTNTRPKGDDGSQSYLKRVLAEVVSRRCAGEDLPDQTVIAAHPELMPKLEAELKELARVEEARSAAERTTTSPRGAASDFDEPVPAPPSGSFPGYEIVREIHRGGQGVVFQAIQKATKRKVAIKVLREGPFATSRDLSRFEREVHILGALNHPNIVAIHDSGTAPTGQAFFVMDYISGQPLDVYMASKERSIEETLKLFTKICEAVNAAHLRGVIHRDLKPSNIRIDANGEPHVLDFGLAKTATGSVTESTSPHVMTVTGQFVGSLPWASPEQALGQPDQIDVRTDVYSLGVILYQMLTSKFPYEVVGNMRDVLENILKAEPGKPSTIRRQINDEVETIVLKCLSKDRERRYQTAGELGRDIGHYLAGEPVEAKRDSGWYVLRKTIARHKAKAITGSGFVLVISVACFFSLASWRDAANERDRAIAAEVEQFRQRMRADEAREEAEQVLDFLTDTLGAANPGDRGKDVTVRDVLDHTAETLARRFASAPLIEARLRATLGWTYRHLGRFESAETNLAQAVDTYARIRGNQDPQTLEAMLQHAVVLMDRGSYRRAEGTLRTSLETARRVLGEEHRLTLRLMSSFAVVLQRQGRIAEAAVLYQDVLEPMRRVLGDEHPATLAAMNDHAICNDLIGRHAEAEEILRKTLEARQRVLGDAHPDTLGSMNNLAVNLKTRGRYADAVELEWSLLDTRLRVMGDDHPDTLRSMNNLAWSLTNLGRFLDAEELFRKALEVRRRVLGDMHPDTLQSRTDLGVVLQRQGQYVGAEALNRETLQKCREVFGDDDLQTLWSKANLAAALHALGRYDEAAELNEAVLAVRRQVLGDQHPKTLQAMGEYAENLLGGGRLLKAESLLLEAWNGLENSSLADANRKLETLEHIFTLYEAWDAAEPGKGYADKAAEWRARLDELSKGQGSQMPTQNGDAAREDR